MLLARAMIFAVHARQSLRLAHWTPRRWLGVVAWVLAWIAVGGVFGVTLFALVIAI